MAENSEIKWYVVHTYSGYENKVKVNLEKAVENNGMQDLITEVTIPTEEVVEIKNNKRKVVQRKLLPGYVLVKMLMTNETWYIVPQHARRDGLRRRGQQAHAPFRKRTLLRCLKRTRRRGWIYSPATRCAS